MKSAATRRQKTTALTLTSSQSSLRRVTAVVLAGGASRRFRPDKLAERVEVQPLLDRVLASLPEQVTTVIVVGAVREVARRSSSPLRSLLVGDRRQRSLPGYAERWTSRVTPSSRCPGTLRLPVRLPACLLSRLEGEPSTEAVVGVDASGREQPLQLALRPAAARKRWWQPPDQRRCWGIRAPTARCAATRIGVTTARSRPSSGTSTRLINCSPGGCSPPRPSHRSWIWWPSGGRRVDRPVVIAIDGPSCSGKSILAAAVALAIRRCRPGRRRLLSGHAPEL